ncbi:L-histidine N(alpha)-methyltransferase [Chloroflexota bacterium]
MNKIELRTKEELEARLCQHLEQRQIPDYALYLGNSGVKNWLDLDNSTEFTVASSLTDLLRQSVPALASHIPGRFDMVSLGVGGGEKEQILLETLVKRSVPAYYAVDISSEMVDKALATVADIDIEKTGMVAFLEDLPRIKQFWTPPVLLCLLGNNFCNYDPDYLLKTVHTQLRDDDLFLFDCQLLQLRCKEQIEQMYRSRLNAHFNLGPLIQRGMDPDSCAFHLELLPLETSLGTVYRTRKWLEILKDSVISCGGNSIVLRAGDTVSMGGFTYKHTCSQVRGYLHQNGFREEELFLSPDETNLLVLARKAPTG